MYNNEFKTLQAHVPKIHFQTKKISSIKTRKKKEKKNIEVPSMASHYYKNIINMRKSKKENPGNFHLTSLFFYHNLFITQTTQWHQCPECAVILFLMPNVKKQKTTILKKTKNESIRTNNMGMK